MNASPPDRRLFGIYGAGGCGRGVLPVARSMLIEAGQSDVELVFVDDTSNKREINGHRVLTLDEFAQLPSAGKRVSIAIADPRVRQQCAGRVAAKGLKFFSPRSPETIIMDDVEIGEGAILSPFVSITSNVRIGRHFHANLYSYVEHDCVIGDFVTFAPSVRCNGNIVVEDRAYLGAGCVLKQGTPGKPLIIGEGAVVGMGAVVTRSVAPGVTVVGNPAKPLT